MGKIHLFLFSVLFSIGALRSINYFIKSSWVSHGTKFLSSSPFPTVFTNPLLTFKALIVTKSDEYQLVETQLTSEIYEQIIPNMLMKTMVQNVFISGNYSSQNKILKEIFCDNEYLLQKGILSKKNPNFTFQLIADAKYGLKSQQFFIRCKL